MKAKVVGIQSGCLTGKRERQVELLFADADLFNHIIKVSESALGIAGLKLDDELDVGFTPVRLYEGLAGEGLRKRGTGK